MQDYSSFQQAESSDDDSQAWAVPFADMMTLLLTLFILLIVILKESEKFIDKQINLILDATYEQLIQEIDNENVVIERVTKGIQITIRGNLFRSMKADVNPQFIPIISDISKIIKGCELFNLEKTGNYNSLLDYLKKGNLELNLEVRCEGHTDNAKLPLNSKFNSNWELSSARSLEVVRLMSKDSDLPEKYFSYIGYGEYRPLIDVTTINDLNEKRDARTYNRRVEIYLDAFARPKTRSSKEELILMQEGKIESYQMEKKDKRPNN